MIVAHEDIARRLSIILPRVVLFEGPQSVGKWTTAEEILRSQDVTASDTLRVRRLTAEAARDVAEFAYGASVSWYRVAIINLDGSTKGAVNTILKSLEDAPESTRFILIASGVVPPTVRSRAQTFRFRLLRDDEVVEVLTVKRGFKSAQAAQLAKFSMGQVRRAIAMTENGPKRIDVLQAVKSIRDRDESALDKLALKWTDEHTYLMTVWANEALTGRWRIFLDTDHLGVSKQTPLAVLRALKENVRPRFIVRASLMAVLREQK